MFPLMWGIYNSQRYVSRQQNEWWLLGDVRGEFFYGFVLVIQMRTSWVWWLMSVRDPQIQGQPGLHSDTLCEKKRVSFRTYS